ncbi:hypothetical protein A3I56_01270 [Candidatus Roizmanbacteria bacterium RIFCSPLOWO2_02_FULL_43_10]|uniref:Uncharacterized protein n=1 Tax=Candidatus Roizmanbacteria bacterium RIFCSPLOWO2_02_FULL_43_10 TaxID=1802078 RepID=A0A1F7JUI6_9BACT|nr:MAG: hypothetical protein A3I56_01270 [Candidatus Roizmanbacteria bacterium RIFCSPLOWO2_02_FULL_43_10]
MAQERLSASEDESLWKSRLFKFGVVAAVAGAFLKAKELITVGIVAVGAAWATFSLHERGKGKK